MHSIFFGGILLSNLILLINFFCSPFHMIQKKTQTYILKHCNNKFTALLYNINSHNRITTAVQKINAQCYKALSKTEALTTIALKQEKLLILASAIHRYIWFIDVKTYKDPMWTDRVLNKGSPFVFHDLNDEVLSCYSWLCQGTCVVS